MRTGCCCCQRLRNVKVSSLQADDICILFWACFTPFEHQGVVKCHRTIGTSGTFSPSADKQMPHGNKAKLPEMTSS